MKLLSLVLLTPLAGATAVACVPSTCPRAIRAIALAAATLCCALCWALPFHFDVLSPQLQLVERHVWNPAMGSWYALGVDGFSLPMLLLSSVLGVVAVLASPAAGRGIKGYYIWLLALLFGLIGVFLAQDWALFYVFWELTLIPLFFLIDLWGGRQRHRASMNFVLYTMGGSVFMLLALLAIYQGSPVKSTSMDTMQEAARALSPGTQAAVFIGLLVGFGVKTPIVPLHGWLPLAHVEAPSPVSILLSGALLKMGAYGLIRAAEMLPAATQLLQPMLAGLALLGIVYGGLLAWRQTDLKSMIAYSSISHMGIVLLGLATLNPTGLIGATLQMSAHGLVAGSLFLLIGLLYERTHTREIGDYSALVRVTPRFAALTTLTLLAATGLPGSLGFVAELHTLIGGFQRFGWWTLTLGAGILITAAYGFRTIGGLFTGPVRPAMAALDDLKPVELVAAGILIGGTIAFGIAPALPLALISASIARFAAVF
ncbi:MAG: NADH-quinone oxidoreductase subunit M [Methylotetracoccus sp.]